VEVQHRRRQKVEVQCKVCEGTRLWLSY